MRKALERSGSLWLPSRREIIGVLGVGLLAPRIAKASYTPLANTVLAMTTNGGTTPAIDTTGCNLIVVAVGIDYNGSGVLSDSKGNTWTHLALNYGATTMGVQLHYVVAPTVGSGHTFSLNASGHTGSLCVAAFRGADASPFRSQVATDVGSISNSSTPITSPAGVISTDLVVSAVTWSYVLITSVSASGLTASNAAYAGQWGHGIAMAYTTSGFTSASWDALAGFAAYGTYLGPICTAAFKVPVGTSTKHRVITGGE
jgi:hypothetical protein